jgi:acyl-CoA dehydrogenase
LPTCRCTLGGALKRKEKLSARLGDILSLMYLCSATLKRYEAEGRQAADAPLMHWAIWDAMFKAQNAFEGVISNFPNRVHRRAAAPHHLPARPALRRAVGPPRPRGGAAADRAVGHARSPDRRHVRARTTNDPVGVIERALEATVAAEPIEARMRKAAMKEGRARRRAAMPADAGRHAREAGVIDADEFALLATPRRAARPRDAVDDDFPQVARPTTPVAAPRAGRKNVSAMAA